MTGGYVYRGSGLIRLEGRYFYSDFCGGFLRTFRYSNGSVTDQTDCDVNAAAVTNTTDDRSVQSVAVVPYC